MKTINYCVSGMVLGLLVSCAGGSGGGGTPSAPSQLVYTNPSSSSYRFERNASSTATKLVLDLYGPTGTVAQGVAFFLTADTTKVDWANAGGTAGTFTNPGTALDLGTAPQLYKDRVTGSDLQAGLFQKSGSATFDATHPLATIALQLRAGASGSVAIAATAGKQAIALDPGGTTSDITIALGTIAIQ